MEFDGQTLGLALAAFATAVLYLSARASTKGRGAGQMRRQQPAAGTQPRATTRGS